MCDYFNPILKWIEVYFASCIVQRGETLGRPFQIEAMLELIQTIDAFLDSAFELLVIKLHFDNAFINVSSHYRSPPSKRVQRCRQMYF